MKNWKDYITALLVLAALGAVVGAWKLNDVAQDAKERVATLEKSFVTRGEALYQDCVKRAEEDSKQIKRLEAVVAKTEILIGAEEANKTPGIEPIKAARIQAWKLEWQAAKDELKAPHTSLTECLNFKEAGFPEGREPASVRRAHASR